MNENDDSRLDGEERTHCFRGNDRKPCVMTQPPHFLCNGACVTTSTSRYGLAPTISFWQWPDTVRIVAVVSHEATRSPGLPIDRQCVEPSRVRQKHSRLPLILHIHSYTSGSFGLLLISYITESPVSSNSAGNSTQSSPFLRTVFCRNYFYSLCFISRSFLSPLFFPFFGFWCLLLVFGASLLYRSL